MQKSVSLRAANDNAPGTKLFVQIPILSSAQVSDLVDLFGPMFDPDEVLVANDIDHVAGGAAGH